MACHCQGLCQPPLRGTMCKSHTALFFSLLYELPRDGTSKTVALNLWVVTPLESHDPFIGSA